MAQEIPVLKLVEENKFGISVDLNDSNELTLAINQIISNLQEYKDRIKKNYKNTAIFEIEEIVVDLLKSLPQQHNQISRI